MEGVFILIGALVLIFGMVIWSFVSYHNNLKSGKGLTDDAAPVVETYATVLGKKVMMEQTGSSKMPSHLVLYRVKFRFDDGTETAMSVPQEIFEDLPVGARDLLITQNEDFLDFGGRLGRVPDPQQE